MRRRFGLRVSVPDIYQKWQSRISSRYDVPMIPLDIALRVAALSQLVFVAVLLVRAGWPPSVQRAMALFLIAGASAYLFCSAPELRISSYLFVPVLVLCAGCPAFFWWFAGAVFEDGFRLRVRHWLGLASVVAPALATYCATESLFFVGDEAILRVLQRLVALTLIVLGLWAALGGRTDDLLESRRRFRNWFTLLVGVEMAVIVSGELALLGGRAPVYIGILNVASILIVAHVVGHAFVRVRGQLFETLPAKAADAAESGGKEHALLGRLREAMEQQRVYRREGLTIATLASLLDTQEHVLRRTINQGLGFRNFNEFLNSYRIREAGERLRFAQARKLPVLTIALEVGYGSIGPFNRAFKELMGMTPTEYRARLSAAPASEGPDT